jgi:aminoglycoside phosphotransferase (APT) family kinase protein
MDAGFSDRLLEVLRASAAAPDLDYDLQPEPLTGGFWAELWAFSLKEPPDGWPGALVVRLMPDADVARKETAFQTAAAAAGFPTPVVRASGGPGSGLGRAFMVMDRAPGAPLLSGLNGLGTVTSSAGTLRQIPEVLAASMADLHALDPRPVRSRLDPDGDVPVTVPGLLARLRTAAGEYGRADLIAAAQWLTDHPAPPAQEVICHGDLHPFNLLADANGTRVTVLDWSAALLAPRSCDLAFTSLLLGEPPLVVPRALRSSVRRLGAGLARGLVRCYEQRTHVKTDPGELRWHQGVGCLRALVEMAGWVHQGLVDTRAGHPWLISGPAFAGRLSALTGSRVTALTRKQTS